MLSDAQIGYVAGVLDARGYLSYRQLPNDVILPSVAVALKAPALIHRLCDLTGVKPVQFNRDYNRHNCDEHCPEPHVHIRSEWERWIVTGSKATIVLAACLPYLVTLREEAERLVQTGREAPHKPAVRTKMHELGWPLLAVHA